MNDLTPHLRLPLPHPANDLQSDVLRLRDALQALDGHVSALQTALQSDDVALDQLQELVDAIKANRGDIAALMSLKASAEALEAEVLAREQAVAAEAQARAQADQALQQAVDEKQPALSTATGAEMRAGTEEALRAVSPALVRETVESQRQALRARNFMDATYVNAAATGTVTLDLSQADVFSLTLSGNTTLAISNAPTLSGETFAIVVRVSQGATAFALTWFSGITWLTSGGTAPAAPAANKSVEYVLSTTDGTNWIGRKGAAN